MECRFPFVILTPVECSSTSKRAGLKLWGRNSQDRPWTVRQMDILTEVLTTQAGLEGKGRKKDQSLLHRRLKSSMQMGWQWDPLIQRSPPGTEASCETAFGEHQTHETTVRPQQL